jgi:peptidyl-prolyl cis-trans isomerase A (cyclophilin A)
MTDTPDLILVTPLGEITIRPEYERAPLSARHFLNLVRNGHLDAATFYRVVRSRPDGEGPPTIDVVQGGAGFNQAGEMPSVPHESTVTTGLSHQDGAISLARWPDGQAQGEFFICLGDQSILDGGGPPPPKGQGDGYAVFAQVVSGMDVVRTIHGLPSDAPVPGGDPRFEKQFLTDQVPIGWRVQ